MVTIGRIDNVNEGHVFTAENMMLEINKNKIPRPGKLILLESSLNFCLNDTQEGLSIPWPRIGLHAIQNNNGLRSIYFMINLEVAWPGVYENNVHNNGNAVDDPDENDEGHESDTEEPMTEFYVVPINTAEQDIVEAIFNWMKHCQSLHPDPDDSISEEDFMEAEDDDGEASAEGVRNLHIDDEEKFADAEEDE
ncbi:methylosome subunit pICln-like [Culicoides brevitarsis]|uniref:methylosome subunit pICln-like n=1 Tax=Culicoides brevitarsis TaxID=469753 RepID=UPI00307C27A5